MDVSTQSAPPLHSGSTSKFLWEGQTLTMRHHVERVFHFTSLTSSRHAHRSRYIRHSRHDDSVSSVKRLSRGVPPSHHVVTLSSQHHQKPKGEYSIVRYFEKERDHTHITFIIIYYYNYSILLDFIVNFLLCLFYKLSLIIGVYDYGSVLSAVLGIYLKHFPLFKGVCYA